MRVVTAFFLLGLTAALPFARATTFTTTSTTALARHADRIVTGTVTSVVSYRRGSRIATRVTVTPPDGGAAVVFEHGGGTVDGITMVVVGMPRFEPGERVVVLVAQRGERLRLVGLSDGKLAVDDTAGRPTVQLRAGPGATATRVDLEDALVVLRNNLPRDRAR